MTYHNLTRHLLQIDRLFNSKEIRRDWTESLEGTAPSGQGDQVLFEEADG